MPSISYLITACVEAEELLRLIYYLRWFIEDEDELIVVIDDNNKTDDILKVCKDTQVTCYHHPFTGFIDQWDFCKQKCTKDYIFGLCPDELPSPRLLLELKSILREKQPGAVLIPRVNIFVDDTVDKCKQMYTGPRPQFFLLQENLNDYRWHNWPDFQLRISKNTGDTKLGHTHGQITCSGVQHYMPASITYAIVHIKTIAHQERILRVYDSLKE